MSDFIFLFMLLLTLATIVSTPILLYHLYRSYKNKDKKRRNKLLIISALLILIPGYYWRLLPGSDLLMMPLDDNNELRYNKKITGIAFIDGPMIYRYNSPRSFHGDGYSIWISELPEHIAQIFEHVDSSFLDRFPSRSLRGSWEVEHWKPTPADSNDQPIIKFAHIKLPTLDFELEDLLQEPGNFYAYLCFDCKGSVSDTYIGNVDFYIICPKRRLYIEINHNT